MRMRFAVLITALGWLNALPADADEAAVVTVDALHWLAGSWNTERDGRWSEEHWLAARGGLMVGSNRSGDTQGAKAFEFLRIQADTDGTLTYWAAPGGGAAVPFRLTDIGVTSATFENPNNDFPTRIVYQRDGDRLSATISKAGGEPSMTWTWEKMATAAVDSD